MTNYSKILEAEIENLQKSSVRPKLLLQACCAPCSSYTLEYLTQYFDITLFFYNPNISPESEYDFRADELKKFKDLLDMGIITQEEFDVKKKHLLGL